MFAFDMTVLVHFLGCAPHLLPTCSPTPSTPKVMFKTFCLHSDLSSPDALTITETQFSRAASWLQLGGGSGDALEGKFALLEGNFSGVEDDFQQMKKNMADSGRLGNKSPVQKPTSIFWTS